MKTLITAAFLTFSSLSAHSAFAQQKEAPSVLAEVPPVLAAPGGRFVFGRVSKTDGDQYLLDTQTGRLWYVLLTKDKNQETVQVLQPVLFLSEDGTKKPTPEEADKPKVK